MSEEKKSYTKDEVKAELLRRAAEADNAEDAQKYFEAWARAEAIEVQAEKDAADYDCKREANANDLKGRIIAAAITAGAGIVTGLLSAVIGSYIQRGTAVAVEQQKEEYGLKFQQNHLKAIYEDDLVVRMNDENFKPR